MTPTNPTPSELAAELRRLKQRADQLKQRDGYTVRSKAWRDAVADIREWCSANVDELIAALDRAAGPVEDAERWQKLQRLTEVHRCCIIDDKGNQWGGDAWTVSLMNGESKSADTINGAVDALEDMQATQKGAGR